MAWTDEARRAAAEARRAHAKGKKKVHTATISLDNMKFAVKNHSVVPFRNYSGGKRVALSGRPGGERGIMPLSKVYRTKGRG